MLRLRAPAAVAALTAILASVPLAAQDIPVQEHVLKNGLRVLIVERPGKPTVATAWAAHAGSANERPGMTGIAHLFEHMLFKGSKSIGTTNITRDLELNRLQDELRTQIRHEEKVLRELERRGEIKDATDPKARSGRHQELLERFQKLVKEQQDLLKKGEFDTLYTQIGSPGTNAFTNTDVTCYILTVPANKLEFWCWLESDRLREPVFREFYAERDVVREERRLRTESTPTGKFQEAFNALVWQAHPYHWPVVGWPSDVEAITREQADDFFRTYYAPNNLTLSLVGNLKAAEVLPLLERYFGRIPANPEGAPEVITQEPRQLAEQRMHAEAETTPSANLVWKTPASAHADQAPLDLLAIVLNGRSGRLYRSLVVDQKVATNAAAFHGPRKYAGIFGLNATAAAGRKPEEAEQALRAEIQRLQKDGVTEEELQKAKNQYQANRYRRMEDDLNLAIQLATSDAVAGYRSFLAEPGKAQAVTREDLQRVAAAHLTPQNLNVALYTRKPAAPPQAVPKPAAAKESK